MNAPWRSALHAALLIGAAGGLSATARAGEAAARFDPPTDRPMVLSRTLWRGLADGKAIVATRRYRVRFTPNASGWRVDGELIASEIDAPPALAPFAALEQARPDDALFPLTLDSQGRIVAGDESKGDEGRAAVERAIALAAERLREQRRDPATAEPIARFLQQLQTLAAASVTARWPAELFLPAPGARSEEHRFALPDGGEGLLSSELESVAAEDRATMAASERRIVTDIAGNRRVTVEKWTLAPLDGRIASRR